jgi:hypothetical protein
MMSPSRRKKWIAAFGGMAALFVLIGALWATRSHRLLEHATRLADGSFRSYVWQSPDRLALLLQTDELEQRDMKSGARTLGSLGAAIHGSHVWRASPDSIRLLTFDDGPAFYVVGPAEAEQKRVEFDGWGGDSMVTRLPGVAWLPDSRRWLALSPSRSRQPLRLYSVDAPDSAAVTLPMPTAMTNLVGVTPDLRVVQTDARPPDATATNIAVITFGIYPNRAPVHSSSFPLPVTAQIKDLELAPAGDRLAWLLVDARRSPLVTMLVRLLPTLGGRFPPTQGISVWVSRLDGTEMHEIGFEQTHATGKDTNVATDLRWMPDGKHLSFLMNDALYSVPAP